LGIIVNKADGVYPPLEKFCADHHAPVLAHILYSQKLAQISAEGKLAVQHNPQLRQLFESLWETVIAEAAS